MAINPISSFFPTPDLPVTNASQAPAPATPPATAPTPPPSLEALQALEGSALDPMLVDPSTADATNQSGTQDPLLAMLNSPSGTSSDPLLGSFNSMTGGDPLLDDLNNLDNPSPDGVDSSDPAAATDAALNQDLTSFLIQQATSTYSASQLLGGTTLPGSGSTGALGNTTA
jgi:hypothetical protein